MDKNSSIRARLDALLKDFCADVGLTMDDRATGIEFEADHHVVLITPDPRQSDRLLIEVSVQTLEQTPFELLVALHRLNDAARLEHDWVVTIGVDDQLRIHTQREIDSCRSSDLQTLLAEGIERARALQSLCNNLADVSGADSPGGVPSSPDFSMMLNRG
jgi:hypothetical protein